MKTGIIKIKKLIFYKDRIVFQFIRIYMMILFNSIDDNNFTI